jgi:opacity protein-like surface antigen
MRRILSVSVLSLLAVGLTSPLAAQRRDRGLVELAAPSLRGGFYVAGGLGAGRESYKFSDESSYSDALTKPTLLLRLGGTPDSYVRVGGEVFGWRAKGSDGDETFTTVMGTVQFYPLRDGGLFLKAGGGWAESAIDFFNGARTSETGFGWSVGAGYELQLSRNLAIGPSVELFQGSFTRRDEPTLNERVLNIGGQITFQTGGRRR